MGHTKMTVPLSQMMGSLPADADDDGGGVALLLLLFLSVDGRGTDPASARPSLAGVSVPLAGLLLPTG